jgi:hypothetical protein
MKILLAVLASLSLYGAIHTDNFKIKKFDGHYYYAPALKGKTQLVFTPEDVKNGKVKMGDTVIGVFVNNEEEDLAAVIKK